MLVTFAIVVFLSSIVVFFADEFGGYLKKILAIPGAKLLLPLVLASFFVEIYEGLGLWLLARCQVFIHQLIYQCAKVLPFEKVSITVARIVYLFLVASLPLWIFRFRAMRRGQRKPQHFAYYLALLLWMVATILLTVA